jgi:hypothetical protein
MAELQGASPYRYLLESVEVEWITMFCEALQAFKGSNRSQRICDRGDTEIKVEGFIAEYAVAWHFGIDWEDRIIDGPDEGIDLVVSRPGQEVGLGVKARPDSARSFGEFLVMEKQTQREGYIPDWFVFCYVDVPYRLVELRGVASLETVKNRQARKLRPDGPPTLLVGVQELKSVPPPIQVGPDAEKRRFFRPARRRYHYQRERYKAAM